ncbi:hypothetical protein RRF57_011023 [Xylaria bambusicola]|uniref:Uncharacterized protein n=1 Tax=Xylaria bambusicola TaxID=326684 RepID=A0AAN7UXY5_9PEZI
MTLATRFPHRFRIGNDICYIPRIRKILEGRLGTPFIRRILKPEEIGQPRTARILGARKNNAGGSLIFSAITRQDFQNNAESIKFFRAVEFMAGR